MGNVINSLIEYIGEKNNKKLVWRWTMKQIYKNIFILGLFLIIIFLILFLNNDVGIRQSNLEKDARKSQKIDESWKVAKDLSEHMTGMLFYDEELMNHTFSIYVNREGVSLGYFFRGGGSIGPTMDDVIEFTVEGCKESAYLSMNKYQVSKIIVENSKGREIIEVDSTKPFAFVLPAYGSIITFYDINGKVVESLEYKL